MRKRRSSESRTSFGTNSVVCSARLDVDAVATEFGSHPAVPGRVGREAPVDVEGGERPTGVLEDGRLGGDGLAERLEQRGRQLRATLLEAEYLPFPLLELLGGVALRALQRLDLAVALRYLAGLRLADLEVVTVRPVPADLEVGDAVGTLLPVGERVEPAHGLLEPLDDVVEFRVVPPAEDAALAGRAGRVVRQRLGERRVERLGPLAVDLGENGTEGRVREPRVVGDPLRQLRQEGQRVPDAGEVTRRRAPVGRSAGEPLQVGGARQLVADRLPGERGVGERRDAGLPAPK